jgi:hypothetical protein
MISLYSGTPGSGKSLHLASRLYHWMQFREAPIIGNFSCDFSRIKKQRGSYLYIDNAFLTPQRLMTFSQNYSEYIGRRVKEGEILLVIDECQLMFNSRDFYSKDRGAWCAFFTQHRKLGFEVILIAQFDRMIDRQIRSLIEYEYIHRKVSNYGIKGKLFALFCGGNLFVAVKMWYPMKEKVGSEFFRYHKKFSQIYDTYALFTNPTANV